MEGSQIWTISPLSFLQELPIGGERPRSSRLVAGGGWGALSQLLPTRSMSSRSRYRSSEDHMCPISKPAFGSCWPVSQYEPVAATVMVRASNVGQQTGTLTTFLLPPPPPSSPGQRGASWSQTSPLARLQTGNPKLSLLKQPVAGWVAGNEI